MIVEVLFPEICNLYGDLMNVEYLQRCCGEIEVVNTGLHDEPYFVNDRPALIYMGSTTEQGQELAAAALMQYKERIFQLVGKSVPFLLTGNALEIFGKEILCEDGRSIPCLGIYNTVAKRDMLHRYNAPWLGKFREMDIVGYKSQFGHSWGENQRFPLFETVRGDGLNPETKAEGIRVNKLMATYLIGPVIVLNPEFAKFVLGMMGVEEPKLIFEEAMRDAFDFRVQEFNSAEQEF